MEFSCKRTKENLYFYIDCQTPSQLLCSFLGDLCGCRSRFWPDSMSFVWNRAHLICSFFLKSLDKTQCFSIYFYLSKVLKKTDATESFQLQDLYQTFWVKTDFLGAYCFKDSGAYLSNSAYSFFSPMDHHPVLNRVSHDVLLLIPDIVLEASIINSGFYFVSFI